MTTYINKIFTLIFFISFAFTVNIKGTVKDKETNEPLIGANVFIDGTTKGSATDPNGAYFISDVRACSTCEYKLKVLYIGYKEYEQTILLDSNDDRTVDLFVLPTSLQVETTKVTAKKRVDKVVEAPATIELVSSEDIKKEEATNLGSYLKGVKGVDFTSSGVNNYSISVRGFNSSFASRLLTLTDGRIANMPALRSINYSTVPQSSKDIESIEIALGPSTALYGANAHSGVVNITSKSPAESEGIDISVSGSIDDDINLFKASTRWASKINDKISFKFSNTYLEANEWQFVAENEYKRHIYPYAGNPTRTSDGKDNNPWAVTTIGWENAKVDTGYYRAFNPADNVNQEDISINFDTAEECMTYAGINNDFSCTPITKVIGDGEANDTGDPDGDGFQGEDWYNGYDDDFDGLIDEDYFFADGIDNDGDCPGDTNGDGYICSWGDEGVDEDIDWSNDTWIDGVDNNKNGEVDEFEERYNNSADKFYMPDWAYDLEYTDIIVRDMALEKYIDVDHDGILPEDQNGDGEIFDYYNMWYNPLAKDDPSTQSHHLRGNNFYSEDQRMLLFDVFIYDYGLDGLPGDPFIDLAGDNLFTPSEGGNRLRRTTIDQTTESGFTEYFINIPTEGCATPLGLNSCNETLINSTWSNQNFDCGFDGQCPQIYDFENCDANGNCPLIANPNYPATGPDFGEGNGVWDSFDWDGDGQWGFVYSYDENGNPIKDAGDNWEISSWNGSQSCVDNGIINTCNDTPNTNNTNTWEDTFPIANGVYDPNEQLFDCGQDGYCWDEENWTVGEQHQAINAAGELVFDTTGQPIYFYGPDPGEDGILRAMDNNELDGVFDTGDNCFGCDGDPFYDGDGDGIYNPYTADCNDNSKDCFNIAVHDNDGNGFYTPPDYKDNFNRTSDLNGDGLDEYPDFEVKNSKTEFRLDFDPNKDVNLTFQTGYAWSKLQQVTGIGRYLADGYEYTYYQIRGRYKNWFSQIYLNQGNSGETRGYDLGNVITDKSRNMAFQLQHNFNIKNTKVIWGFDFFRTEANTNGSILGDGPNGYDNDGDAWLTGRDKIDNDNDSDDFSDWGIDGIGPYLVENGDLVIDDCKNDDGSWSCEPIVTSTQPNAKYSAQYDLYYIDLNNDSNWTPNNSLYPYIENPSYPGRDYGEGDGIPTGGETVYIDTGNGEWDQNTESWIFENGEYSYNSDLNFWYDEMNFGSANLNEEQGTWDFNAYTYDIGPDNEPGTPDDTWTDNSNNQIIQNFDTGEAIYNQETNSWNFNTNYNYDPYSQTWYHLINVNTGDANYNTNNNLWEFNATYSPEDTDLGISSYWWIDKDGDNTFDPGEPGVNEFGNVVADGLDNDCDACDYDGDGIPNYQEIQLGSSIYNPYDYPTDKYGEKLQSSSIAFPGTGYDEMIDETWCGNIQYDIYVPLDQFSGNRDGRYWRCGENYDEEGEFEKVTSNEMGFYFQTKTIPNNNEKWEIITAARFDHHDQLEEDIQFSPKFGLFYKPTSLHTFKLTYGKAYNTPSAITLYTDIFMGRRGIVEYYLRGNRDGTPYTRVGGDFITSTPKVPSYNIGSSTNLAGELTDWSFDLYNLGGLVDNFSYHINNQMGYWDGGFINGENNWVDENYNGSPDCNEQGYVCAYNERVMGSPYFLGFNTEFSNVPEFMPLDTAIYTIWVPELTDTGRIYTPLESINIKDVDPIKTEKIQTIEFGFKGFLSERIHASLDYYTSFYEDFFSSPTVITPLVIKRSFEYDEITGIKNDVTSIANNGGIVGMLTVNANLSNPPYATQWDGRDNDNDWHLPNEYIYLGTDGNIVECPHNIDPCYADWYDVFRWDGYEEQYSDLNNNDMYDAGEPFIDEDQNNRWNCIDCGGEWGWIIWETNTLPSGEIDTLGYNIKFPTTTIQDGEGYIISQGATGQAVGVDEYDAATGLSEAELVTSSEISALGSSVKKPAYAYSPLHSILAPMNYGNVRMEGLDIGLAYLLPEYKVSLDANFSFYGTTNYYNELTKKNDPINAPKFKMNASIGWQSPFGDIAIKYRHVERFEWKDGLWAGFIGPYDLFDLHYNYKFNEHLEFNITGLNIFDYEHKQMIGGAKMGRQIIMRLSASM